MKRKTTTRAVQLPAAQQPGHLSPAIELVDVTRNYGRGRAAVAALRGVSASVRRGTFTAVMGPSGSGKSTLLHCAAGLDVPTSGSVRLAGTDLGEMDETSRTRLRRDRIGFVFQAFNLLPALTVAKNVTLPLRLAGHKVPRGIEEELLERVGLGDRGSHRPSELSGGQQQRVAVARALITRPEVIFCDEPTGALDTVSAREILTLLRSTVDDLGQTVVMVTHDPLAASFADHALFLADGRIVDAFSAPTVDRVAERMTHLGAWA